MSLTTISLQQETKEKLKRIKNKSETWNTHLNKLYENEIIRSNTQIFFDSKTFSLGEALKEMEK